MTLTHHFKNFFKSEKTGGLLLVLCTLFSIILSNLPTASTYISFWETNFQGHSITHWINDGLMSIFFLLIGLELEREIYAGELSDFKNALFPAISAVGGVLIPALIYLIYNYGSDSQSGAGIPMATDIAFAIGILSLLGKSVPPQLKVFLTALAVIDDLCAIIIIAFFYTDDLSFTYLFIALGIFAVLIMLNRLKVNLLLPYLVGGIAMWYFMLHSGVHATISGVMLAFALPFGNGDEKTISSRVQHHLHNPVAFIILPIFALANTCIQFSHGWINGLSSKSSTGIIAGLLAGKPIGIILFSSLAVWLGITKLPKGLNWKHIAGVSLLAGIGFTMSIFITLLAFTEKRMIDDAKIAIIFASGFSAVAGLLVLKMLLRK